MMGGKFPNTLHQPSVPRTLLSLSEAGESSGLVQGCWHVPTASGFYSRVQVFASASRAPRGAFLLSLLSIHRWQQALKSLTSQH